MGAFQEKVRKLTYRVVTEKTITDALAAHKIKELSVMLSMAREKFNQLQDKLKKLQEEHNRSEDEHCRAKKLAMNTIHHMTLELNDEHKAMDTSHKVLLATQNRLANETVANDNLKHNLLIGANHLVNAHKGLLHAADTINKKNDTISNLNKQNELQLKDNQLMVQKFMDEKNLHKIDNAKE